MNKVSSKKFLTNLYRTNYNKKIELKQKNQIIIMKNTTYKNAHKSVYVCATNSC